MKVCVMGAGYVGLVTAACLADMGNSVACLDIDAARVQGLQEGRMPIHEPGLDALVQRNATADFMRPDRIALGMEHVGVGRAESAPQATHVPIPLMAQAA